MPAAQLMFGQLAVRHRFAADEYFPHGGMIAATTDSCAEICVTVRLTRTFAR
jgi:hypothetical protein